MPEKQIEVKVLDEDLVRWAIHGEFNGDGKKEELIESYISTIDGKEILSPKKDLEFDSLVAIARSLKPKVLLKCTEEKVEDLFLRKNFSFLEFHGSKTLAILIRMEQTKFQLLLIGLIGQM